MHNSLSKMDKRGDAKEKAFRGEWTVILSVLLISLVLWGAVILIGQEMFRRLDIEIARGIKDFR